MCNLPELLDSEFSDGPRRKKTSARLGHQRAAAAAGKADQVRAAQVRNLLVAPYPRAGR